MRTAVLCLALAWALPAGAAHADPLAPATPRPDARPGADEAGHTFGLGLAGLKELGFGAVARVRGANVGADLGVAYLPWFLAVGGDPGCTVFKVGAAPHVTGSLLMLFGQPWQRVQHGIRLGGIWNRDLGAGGIAGYTAEISVTPRTVVGFGAGLQLFPSANDFFRRELALPSHCQAQSDPTRELLNTVQPYFGGTLVFYLF